MPGDRRPFEERFQNAITPEPMSGCWLWTRFVNPGGYGTIRLNGPRVLAHRASWTVAHGPIPDGMVVCHKCDTPSCVNPDHLYVGTQRQNMDDCSRRGRTGPQRAPASYRGCNGRGNAKLDASQVVAMRKMRADGVRVVEIAERTGVTPGHVYKVTNSRFWTWVKE